MDLLKKILETKKVAQDKDIKDREGTQPSKYFSGVSKKSKAARDAHFKKGAKMDDGNPAAYKPAPGDAGAETKPSQHTKKFKQMYGENLEEGKLVAPAHQVIRTVSKEIQKKMETLYSKRPSDGVSLINQMARMVGMTVSDKKQKKGTLFLRMGDELAEAVNVKKALSKVKGLTKKQMEVLASLQQSQLVVIAQQLSSLVMGEDIDESLEERLADKLRQKEKDKQQAHQKAMMKSARKSIKDYDKRNKREDVEEDRDYKKEYENYHSKPEQVKRRQKRNEARRSLKNFKDIKGKDVHHKDNNPMNNDKSNLSIVSQNYNRKEPRLRESTKEYGKSLRKIALDRQLKGISKKDKDTLLKIADLLAKEKK